MNFRNKKVQCSQKKLAVQRYLQLLKLYITVVCFHSKDYGVVFSTCWEDT